MDKPYSGVEIEILESLRKVWNFSYHIIDTNGVWGERLPNGSWSGIIGDVYSKVSKSKILNIKIHLSLNLNV